MRGMPDDILQVGPPGRNTEGERLAAQLTVCDGLLDRDAARLVIQILGLGTLSVDNERPRQRGQRSGDWTASKERTMPLSYQVPRPT
jgi:hypothetical protein